MYLAQGHNAVTLVRLEPAAPRSQVKHSTTEPLPSLCQQYTKNKNYMGKCTKIWYLAHQQAMKAQANLYICADWPEPLLVKYRKYL